MRLEFSGRCPVLQVFEYQTPRMKNIEKKLPTNLFSVVKNGSIYVTLVLLQPAEMITLSTYKGVGSMTDDVVPVKSRDRVQLQLASVFEQSKHGYRGERTHPSAIVEANNAIELNIIRSNPGDPVENAQRLENDTGKPKVYKHDTERI